MSVPDRSDDARWVKLPGGNYEVLMTGDVLTPDEAASLVAYFEHCGIRRAHVCPPPPDQLPPGAISDAKSRSHHGAED